MGYVHDAPEPRPSAPRASPGFRRYFDEAGITPAPGSAPEAPRASRPDTPPQPGPPASQGLSPSQLRALLDYIVEVAVSPGVLPPSVALDDYGAVEIEHLGPLALGLHWYSEAPPAPGDISFLREGIQRLGYRLAVVLLSPLRSERITSR